MHTSSPLSAYSGRACLACVELFAGCGGLSTGLDKAGLSVVAANEIWDDAASSFAKNHRRTEMIVGDVTDETVKGRIIEACSGSIDVVAGGPPCQAYSLSGRRDATDPRAHLFEHYVDLVEKLAPRAFVMENVKGLLTMLVDREDLSKAEAREVAKLRLKQDALPDKYTRNSRLSRETLEAGRAERARLKRLIQPFQEAVPGVIKRRFESLGYHTEMQVLNSADFGVPQRRERVVFIGLRSGKPAFPAPTHAESTNGDLFAALAPWRTVREAIDDLAEAPEDELRHHIRTTHSGTFLAKIKKTPVGRSVFESYSDAFFRLQPDQPSRTVKENHNSVFVHYSQPRVMTPRELARLQDFSDDYLFFGTKASVLKQIGNAVPVGLGTALGRSLKAMLSGGECAKESRAKKGPARKASAA